ncbi:cadherin-like domain-containing protein (plasmid) [Vibrio sp. SS-MA-C1-2]|uniref:cadherin-like domain-containing protein n=1 Tax=Vibrio sp. SS-MA-C1-2 TaxID=2908646 RepID=UPI001F31FC1E|nr:cadherin-like domain-containing protein [Vibrio sp. SS-MA-C1-2]UJF20370.1 cadherin-like domain-containing protein [Vibrio sp. SS-MA-C1-2]
MTDNQDGSWTFTPSDNFAGVADLNIVVSDGEYETLLDIPVYVRPVADGAVITTNHDGILSFSEDSTAQLGINVALVDQSESLSLVTLTGFPVGFVINDSNNIFTVTEENQYIDVTGWDLANLEITPQENYTGDFFVTVSATTVDYGDEEEAFENNIVQGDFTSTINEAVTLTREDLLSLFDSSDVANDDEIKLVHLADRDQGSIIDNGDNTWTFTPSTDFSGEIDLFYAIDQGGILQDQQFSIAINDSGVISNHALEANTILTAQLAEGATLSFTEQQMLDTLTDQENDALSIESIRLLQGDGVLETLSNGEYQFTPAENYTGEAQVGFVASDGENQIESFFNVEIGDDDTAYTYTENQLLEQLGLTEGTITNVEDVGDLGFFTESAQDEWTFWPNDDFTGEIVMDVTVDNGGQQDVHSLSLTANEFATEQVSSHTTESDESVEVNEEVVSSVSDADIMAAPGDDLHVDIPTSISSNQDVDYVEISGLPEGAEVTGALDNSDGTYTISGDLTQDVCITLGDTYQGSADLQFQGYDSLNSLVPDTQETISLDVDEQYAGASSPSTAVSDADHFDDHESHDWISAGDSNNGIDIDFTDDSQSHSSPDNEVVIDTSQSSES